MTVAKAAKKLLGAIALSATIVAGPAYAQSYEQFAKYDETSERSVNYQPIDDLYKAISVKDKSRHNFRYDALSGQGLSVLDAYVGFFAGFDTTTLNKDEQLAFWLNLRNLLVVKSIAADKPSRSLRKDRGTFTDPGEMWTRKRMAVMGVNLSIDDIERKIILANWTDPDVVYGLYQGFKGSPAFSPPKNYSGSTVKEELAARGAKFVNARGTVRVRKDVAQVSGIYEWYMGSVFSDEQALVAHLKAHSKSDLGGVQSVSYKKVDFNLDQEAQRVQRQLPSSGGGGFGGGAGGGGGGGGGS